MIPFVFTGDIGKNSIAAKQPPIPIIGNRNPPNKAIMTPIRIGCAYYRPTHTKKNDTAVDVRMNMY